jgi:hypothetical protein
MSDAHAIASPHPAYHIFAQFHDTSGRWVYRVFGPETIWSGTFASAHEAIAFVVRSTETDAPEADAVG